MIKKNNKKGNKIVINDSLEKFDLKGYERVVKKIKKDCCIMDARVSSWEQFLFIKLNKYDNFKIINKIELFMSKLLEVRKDYQDFLIKSLSVKTNKELMDIIIELPIKKSNKNKLYIQCKSIDHLQGLVDLRSIKK